MTNPDCSICFFTIEDEVISCSKPDCTSKICTDCAKLYINFTFNEPQKTIPTCPSKECNGEILYSQVRKCHCDNTMKKYQTLCLEYVKNDNFDDLISKNNQKTIIQKIRDERHQFIKQSYPSAISYVIEVALKTKLNRIDKKNQEHIKHTVNKSNKKCPNILCYSGVLDVNYICLTCTNKFCKKCEAQITDEGYSHLCKKEDLDSISAIEKLVKCPKCKLPVTKSYGCDNMTCSICKTNFNFITGKISSAGNHSDDSLTLMNHNLQPSILFAKDGKYDEKLLNLLRKIENKKPGDDSFKIVLSWLKRYIILEEKMNGKEFDYKNPDYEEILNKISRRYENYKLSLNKKHSYFKFITLIQKYHEKNELTYEILEKIDKIVTDHITVIN